MLQVFFAYLRPAPISVNSSPFSPGFLSHPDITSQQPPHNLESNFTLNVVPVRLPSRDKVPVCPCLIHEEHLLRVSDETWQWHKMKVDTWARLLAKSWKMWEGVALQIKAPWRLGGHQIWDMLKIQHVDILFRGCRHIWYQGRAEQAVKWWKYDDDLMWWNLSNRYSAYLSKEPMPRSSCVMLEFL